MVRRTVEGKVERTFPGFTHHLHSCQARRSRPVDTLQQDQASHVTSMDCQTKRTFTLQINSGIMKLCFVSFAVMSGSTEIDRRGPVGRVHVGLWDTSSAMAVPAGQHPCMFLGRPGRGALGRGLKRKELPVSRWRFRRGLELYRRRKRGHGQWLLPAQRRQPFTQDGGYTLLPPNRARAWSEAEPSWGARRQKGKQQPPPSDRSPGIH